MTFTTRIARRLRNVAARLTAPARAVALRLHIAVLHRERLDVALDIAKLLRAHPKPRPPQVIDEVIAQTRYLASLSRTMRDKSRDLAALTSVQTPALPTAPDAPAPASLGSPSA